MPRLLSVIVAVAFALVFAAPGAAQQTLRIGELAVLTGPAGPPGIAMHNGRLLAIAEVNARGGVKVGGVSHPLEMVHLDAPIPTEAIKAFERLLTVEKVNLILDGNLSSTQYALGPVLKSKNALMIWSLGNDPETTVGVPNAFRNHFDGGIPLMKTTELFLKKMGVKRVVTYGQTGHADFKRFVEEYLPKVQGLELVASEWHAFGEKDFFPVLTKLKGLKFDAILTHGFAPDGINMLKQAREIGLFPGPLWLGQYGASPWQHDEASRKIWEGAYENLFSSWAVTTTPPEKSKKLFEAYSKRFGEQGFGPYAETGWDSVFILAKALEKAGTTTDIPKIIAAMRELTVQEIPELTLQYKPGKLFDSDNQAYPVIIVAQWKDQKLVPVFSDYGK